jgi:hypothetical protein
MILYTITQTAASLGRLGPDTKVATLATIPGREDELRLCLGSLCPQMDAVVVVFNYAASPLPGWLEQFQTDVGNLYPIVADNSMGDAMKFGMSEHLQGWQFICDDDIVYPADFADRLMDRAEHYGRRAVVGVSGAIIPAGGVGRSYYSGRTGRTNTFHTVPADMPVNLVMSCGICWHSSLTRLSLSEFRCRNMGDVFLALHCQRERIPCVVAKHAASWLKYPASMRQKPTIWAARASHDHIQAAYINEIADWRIWPAGVTHE